MTTHNTTTTPTLQPQPAPQPKPHQAQCGSCHHYHATEPGAGECYRFPPQRVATGFSAKAPEIAASRKACGEYHGAGKPWPPVSGDKRGRY